MAFVERKNVKLFIMDNPNFKILNTPEKIIEMLPGTAITVQDLKGGPKLEAAAIVGFVNFDSEIVFKDGNYYGDIHIRSEYKDYGLVNYEVQIKDEDWNSELREGKFYCICGIQFGGVAKDEKEI
ncbi:MAG: hypothetical protein AB9836_04660 [Aminipila sp.]